MNECIAFSADHQGFYCNETPFYPVIQQDLELTPWSNCVLLPLPARLGNDLNWEKEIEIARGIAAAGKWILWEIDLGLDAFKLIPEDTASFYSFSIPLEEFSKRIWPSFKNSTFGACVYKGFFTPKENFPEKHWKQHFEEAFSQGVSQDYALYCAQLLSEYLHRLISFLPEAVLPFAFFDVSSFTSIARISQLFSKERFEYLSLGLKGADFLFAGITWGEGRGAQGWLGSCAPPPMKRGSASLGICLPKDFCMSAEICSKFDHLIENLHKNSTCFRIISEEKLTEEWDGLNQLVVFSSALSAQGRRKLHGFAAAGGSIVTCGNPIGIHEEIPLEWPIQV